MRKLVLIAMTTLSLSACFSSTETSAPATMVVPQGASVVCPNGAASVYVNGAYRC